MKSPRFERSSRRARLASAVFAAVCSLSSLAAVLAMFASASGELDPALAKFKSAPSASEVAAKVPARRVRS